MASRSLGSLTIDLIAKIGGWTQGLTKAERDLDRSTKRMNKMANDFGRSIGASLRSAATGFLAFAGVSVSIGAAATAIKGAIDRADQLRDASIRLGIGVETLSAYGYAAQQTGTDIEELNKGLLRLARNAATALDPKSRQSNLFEALGVSKDALSDFDKLVPQVANAFSQMEDGATKAALAQELFGRSGANLIEFLNQGESGLKTLTDRARELGVVINDETAAAADDFNDKLGDLKAAGTGLATQVASELLPQLTNLVDWAIDFVSDGDNAREIADGLSDGFKDLSDAVGSVASIGSGLLDFLGRVREGMSGLEKQAKGATQALMSVFTLNEQQRNAGFALYQQGTDQINGKPRFAGVQGTPTRLPTVSVVGNLDSIAKQEAARIKEQKTLQDRINKYLGNPTGRTDKPKKTGKSDAEKEAERLAKAINKMTDAQREWQTELDGTGNKVADAYADRISDITEKSEDFIRNGVPKEKVAEFREEMTKLAEALKAKETAEFLEEFNHETAVMVANSRDASTAELEYASAVRELNKELKSGIVTQKEYSERLEALESVRTEASSRLIRDLEFEISLLGKTREEQELLTEARLLGAEAATEQGQAALQALKDYQAAEKQNAEAVDIADGARDSFRGLLSDLREGKSLWDSLTDAALNFLDVLFEIAAKNATEQLFGAYGSTGSGTTGGGWLSAFADFFSSANSGFGFSEGGFTGWGGKNQVAGIVHKGEYVMPMDAVSRIGVSGMDRIARGGALGPVSIPQNFIVQGRIDSRTAKQLAQEAATQGRRAMARSAG